MKRVAQLIRTAGEIRRSIWASLPFRARLAEVLCRLADSNDTNDAFGTGMYGVFLENGVEGMPPINGKPASEWLASHSVKHLPRAYGREFGRKAFLSVMGKHHNPATAEDLLSGLLDKFLHDGHKYFKPGMSLKRAEAYVMFSLNTQGINLLRRKRFEVGESMLHRDDESPGPGFLERVPAPEPGPPELTEEEEEEELSKILTRLRPELRHIHPSAEQYLRLLLEGYTDVQILGNPGQGRPPMLDNFSNAYGRPLKPSTWIRYKKRIKNLVVNALHGHAEALPL